MMKMTLRGRCARAVAGLVLSLSFGALAAAQESAASPAPADSRRVARVTYYFLSVDKGVVLSDKPFMPSGEFHARLRALENKDRRKWKYHVWAERTGVVRVGESVTNTQTDWPGVGDSEAVEIATGEYGDGGKLVWLGVSARKTYRMGRDDRQLFNWSVNTRATVPNGSVAVFGGFDGDEELNRRLTKDRETLRGLRPQLLYVAVEVHASDPPPDGARK